MGYIITAPTIHFAHTDFLGGFPVSISLEIKHWQNERWNVQKQLTAHSIDVIP
jgi:hypothetical protein